MIKSAARLVPDILKKVIENKSIVDPLKLQKLLYYTQAWSLVFREQPMFFEEIQAWVHGPVVPSVYHEHKCYSYRKISLLSESQEISTDELQIIDLVCDVYGHKTGRFLEDLTHSENPWINARIGLSNLDRSNSIISLQEMMSYYSKFVETKQPPRISPQAVQIPDKQFPSRSRAFLAGMGSVLDIMPVPKFNHRLLTEADFNNSSADLEALQSDWSNVGSYFEDAIAKIKAENPQLNE
jgi:uncharacterized phage-associated protein